MTKFLIVDCPSAYNVVIGRPLLTALHASVSIWHLSMKFPTSAGLGCVRGDQREARECYNASIVKARKGAKENNMIVCVDREEVDEMYINPHSIVIVADQEKVLIVTNQESNFGFNEQQAPSGQFEIKYQPRSAIKGQALANFIAECTGIPDVPDETENVAGQRNVFPTWKLYVNGSLNEHHVGVGLILITPEQHRIHYALRFRFNASNNEAEYEALLAGLRLARDVHARSIQVNSDSQLVVYQILGEYQARGLRMVAYLNKAKNLLVQFEEYTIKLMP
ncbi:uncharacterized protein LOC133823896 [Humulus lupulus]|uniref:uncharacterized protein LOC133823896 n=1 Tax=Humulus lupulus TaxID=3486 RepID=UPI002B410F6A|nr:uncharacterized protein LOC133823896 [Humulus lupulus]